ncbi:HNH endonuclease [Rhizobium acaciae]|uniref:HNH endonuclease n=1 Tax=Rhizobium acaciae TaxID=2989736 RepID=UPI00221FA0B6|nr:HNH endonuclease [Rhizobium acaciae]MCW1755047.1 HNH endonuclease [Rhizobium acaciae]
MSRKQFIQSRGASCLNWIWSWSFVNHDARFVIFGLWQDKAGEKLGLILHPDWQFLGSRRQNGYSQAIEHIRLVEKEGYALRTFPMKGAPRYPDRGEHSPSTIAGFTPELTDGRLVVLPDGWYVSSLVDRYETIAEVVDLDEAPTSYLEGAVSSVLVNAYERNQDARRACIGHFGLSCTVCEVNFGAVYGALGDGYIHVHHIKPIHLCGGEYEVDPIKDLVPVCANCHAMIHRRRIPLTVDELRGIMMAQRQKGRIQPGATVVEQSASG